MSGKRESNASNRAKKKPKSIKDALLASSEQIHKSLQAQHKGKRLLLTAMSIYHSKSKIPEGEENFNFLYRVAEINPGGLTCTLKYEGKYFEEGGTDFRSYPAIDDSDLFIEN